MDLFTYLLGKKGQNTQRDLFSYLLGKEAGGSGTYVNYTGTSLNISNTLKARIKNIELKGATSQDGTPSPDYPQKVKVVTGDNSIVIKGKNLFEESSEWNFVSSIGTGEFAGQFPRNTTGNRRTFFYLVKPNTKYTVSFTTPGDRLIIWEHYSIINPSSYTILNPIRLDNRLVDISSDIPTEYTFTTSGNAKIVAIYYSLNILPINLEIKQTQIYPISLGTLELAKIGDYQDYIYGTPNNWYKYKYIQKVVFDGTEAWSKLVENTNTIQFIVRSGIPEKARGLYNAMSDLFKIYSGSVEEECITGQSSGTGIQIIINKARATTSAEFKEWLSTHNVTAYYELNTPTSEPITDTTLIEQLNNLYNATSQEGTTIITCSSASDSNEIIVFSGDVKVTSVGLGNSLNTSLLSSNIQNEEEPNVDEVNETEDIEQNDEPIENEEPIEEEVS